MPPAGLLPYPASTPFALSQNAVRSFSPTVPPLIRLVMVLKSSVSLSSFRSSAS